MTEAGRDALRGHRASAAARIPRTTRSVADIRAVPGGISLTANAVRDDCGAEVAP
jgi:hypothetical protein